MGRISFDQIPEQGFSDGELEALARTPSRWSKGPAPWVCWESENSSFGRCYREIAGFPRLVPLFVNSCHGAYHGSVTQANEIDGRAQAFLGWPESRVADRRNKGFSKSYLVEHPWLGYRRRNFPELGLRGEGALYFFPHSNNNFVPEFESWGELVDELESIRNRFGSLTICLSFHDVKRGLHKSLRSLSYPLLTLGNTNHRDFVFRFYSTIDRFKVSLSSELGSQVYYSLEAGQRHFLTESKPSFFGSGLSRARSEIRTWEGLAYPEEAYELEQFEHSLRDLSSSNFSEQIEFARQALGYGKGLTSSELRNLLWRELRQNLPCYLLKLLTKMLGAFIPSREVQAGASSSRRI